MRKTINKEVLRSTLQDLGWTQAKLAKNLDVTSQSVTNWLKGTDFPRPNTLLKLATTLKLNFEQLVETETNDRPIVAFRKKAGTKTKDLHLKKACEVGMLLKPLVPFLSNVPVLRTQITSPSMEYSMLQATVSQVRSSLGIGEKAKVKYEELISEFSKCGAVLVPVLKGERRSHENALHIRLPTENMTFIFLNLDTHLEDFKFWMSHELAHVYTPELAGTEEGEDYADAFAGAFLFPKINAKSAYKEACKLTSKAGIKVLCNYSEEYEISLNTVFQQVKYYALNEGLPKLNITEKEIHIKRSRIRDSLVSEAIFDPLPPKANLYIAACDTLFQSDFFPTLERMINENETGVSYVQQILDISLQDATAIHKALMN